MSNSINSNGFWLNPVFLSSTMRTQTETPAKGLWMSDNWHPAPRNLGANEPQTIYDQYLAYYQQCNDDIYAIDQLPPEKRSLPNVIADRATIVEQQAALGKIYQQDNSGKTLPQFIQDCADAEKAILEAYTDAIGSGGDNHGKIAADYRSGQSITTNIGTTLTQDAAALDTNSFQTALTALQSKIDAETDPGIKEKAQADFTVAQAAYAKLQGDCTNAKLPISAFQSALDQILQPGGSLAELQALADLASPTDSDVGRANELLAGIQNVQTNLQTFQNGSAMGAVTSDTSALQAAIQKVKQDLRPAPTPGDAEHSCWDIDWTTHMAQGTPIPPGVTMVNLFVGKIDKDAAGNPIVGGFADLKPADIKAFADKCRDQGVSVKISIGGGGGSYDNCWNVLNDNNINAFAQMLADFCHTNGLAGVDFDYEEYNSQPQQILVGNLIRQFKMADPSLQTTLCTNAGFGSQYPWPAIVQTVMDAASDPTTGECKLDRLNVMSYYNPVADEEGWLNGWANWTSSRYGFKPSQIGVGIDGFDGPHVGDMTYIAAMAQFAAQKGFSTGYWAYNPADAANSDKFCKAVFDNYQSGKTFLGRIWNAVRSAFTRIQAAISFMFNPSFVDKNTRSYNLIKTARMQAKLDQMQKAQLEWNKKPVGIRSVSYRPIKEELQAKALAKQSGMMRPYQLNMQVAYTAEPSAPPQSPKASDPAVSNNYIYEEYVNNWGGTATPPPGVSGSQAFAVVNADGTFDSRYPLAGGGNTALAVGGWNNSQVGGGLNTILTAPLNPDGSLTTVQQKLLDGLLSAAKQYGYNKILLDFEAYASANPAQVSKTYTKFLQELGSQLHALGKQLDICTSPAIENQNYYDINQLLSSVDHYQVMTYDYAQGGSVVTSNASVSQSKTYLDTMLKKYPGLTQSMLMLGVPTYGIQFSITPGMTQSDVQKGIQDGTLQGAINNSQPGTGSAEMANDLILQDIGDWTNPSNGWVHIMTNSSPADYFYYNQAKGSVITAFPPASVKDFATMVKQNYPDVTGFFGWEASDESNGAIMKELINDTSAAPSLASATSEVKIWLVGLRDNPNQDPTLKQWAGDLLSKLSSPPATLDALAVILNGAFNPAGVQDIYMQIPALLEVDGQVAPNGGNVINLLNQLFAGNSDLIALQGFGLNIPTPTLADMTFAQVSAWIPQVGTDPAVKTFILKNIGDAGSGFTHDQIKQLYWGNSWKPHNITRSDDALLQQLMYANTSLVQGAYERVSAWQPTSDRAKALKGKMLEEIDPTKKHFSKREWQKYCEGIISKLKKVDAKQKIQALLGYEPVRHGNQGGKKV